MLPPGHDLSEVMLSWIAKLSCILTSALVLNPFREEIKRRTWTQQHPANARSRILSPDDVAKTLQKYGVLGEGNRSMHPQPEKTSTSLRGRLPSTVDAIPLKSAVLKEVKTNQRVEKSQENPTVRKQQIQVGQSSNESGTLQYPASQFHPPTSSRSTTSANNSDSQGLRVEGTQSFQKRMGVSEVTDCKQSKRAKANTNVSLHQTSEVQSNTTAT
jgi:hypothetical protein